MILRGIIHTCSSSALYKPDDHLFRLSKILIYQIKLAKIIKM